MHRMALAHLYSKSGRRIAHLYRIFFYDCPPLSKKVHRPVSKRSHDFAKDHTSQFRNALHREIKQLRKTALRLGRRDEENASWQINPDKLKQLIAGRVQFNDLTDDDFTFYAKQKVVDMKIGLDIASIAHKRLATQIVLVAGDSDFVPAAKQARREGIDFILDPMWNHINPDLNEHIDGLHSTCPNPLRRHVTPIFVPPDEDIEEPPVGNGDIP